ncbi:unnamed protein product, partial [Musa acuminata var. zebrina]
MFRRFFFLIHDPSRTSQSSRSNRLRSLVAEQSTTAAATDPSFFLEKVGSGSARGDGERTNPDPAYTSSGSPAAASAAGTSSGTSLGIIPGSGPGPSRPVTNTAGPQPPVPATGSPFVAFSASSDSPRRRIATCPTTRWPPPGAGWRGFADL